MVALFDTGSLGDAARIRLGFALGKAFDDLGDYATAIRYFDAANAIEKRLTTFDRDRLTAWVEPAAIAHCTPDWFALHAALGVPDGTPVFIVGMPRSGTTLVEQIVPAIRRWAAATSWTFGCGAGRRGRTAGRRA